jgi:addiction module HigA family antidote
MNTEDRIILIHPGKHLADFLEELGITQYRLAKDIQVPPGRIHEIIQGKRGISADTALCLARYFDTSPDYWMNLQSHYDLEMAEQSVGARIRQAIQPQILGQSYSSPVSPS